MPAFSPGFHSRRGVYQRGGEASRQTDAERIRNSGENSGRLRCRSSWEETATEESKEEQVAKDSKLSRYDSYNQRRLRKTALVSPSDLRCARKRATIRPTRVSSPS